MSLYQPQYSIGGEGQEKLEELSSSDRDHLRMKMQTDLFFLSKWGLGYNQVCESAHGALCRFMTDEERLRRMVLMPRGHLKTTICTISDSIRLSLIDPNTRILIQNEVFENASDMLTELQGHWTGGDILRGLFPELVPTRFTGPGTDWSKDSCSIIRTRNFKESTYTAAGSGGSPQSKHFNFIKNDDLIGEKHKDSEKEMSRTIGWADSMEPLLDSPAFDRLDYYGTRKTMADVYHHVMEKEGKDLAVFAREPIEGGVPIFPLKYPLWKLLDIQVKTPEMWAYDFMNNPIGKGGLDWGRGLLRTFDLRDDKVVFQDHITGELCYWLISELDIVITADPNSGKLLGTDKAAVVVHGVSPEQHIFILEAWSARVQPDGFIDAVWELAYKWHPRVIGFEEAGQQNSKYYFEKRQLAEGLYYNLKDLKHMNMDKERRIRGALDTPLKARRLYVLAGSITLINQIQLFPQLAKHNWDELDALAYGPQLYQAGSRLEDLEAAEEAEEKLMAARGVTGYGVSV